MAEETKTPKRTGAVKKAPTDNKTKQANPVTRYFRETRGELKKVTWPSREESIRLTIIVLAVTILFAFFLWGFDSLFSRGIQELINLIISL